MFHFNWFRSPTRGAANLKGHGESMVPLQLYRKNAESSVERKIYETSPFENRLKEEKQIKHAEILTENPVWLRKLNY